MRNKIVGSIVLFSLLVLVAALLNLQVIEGRKFKDLSEKNRIRLLTQSGARGRILDRNGKVIVGNRLSYDVLILPQDEKQLENTLLRLAQILNVSAEDLKVAFQSGYVAPSIPVAVAKNIDLKKVLVLEELKLDFPDLVIQPHPIRDYPYGSLACHVLGYLNEIDHWRLTKLADYGYKTKDIVGFGGVEEKYDYYLRQEEGAISEEVDHRGRFMRVVGFKPPKNGKDVELTLDLAIQKIVEDKLGNRNGSVILMDPYNGQIIAMASSPNFVPAAFVKKSGSYITDLFANPEAPLLNRATSGIYPPGSVFKPVVATAALESDKINLTTTFLCTGSIYIGTQEFSCWAKHGPQNIFSALAHSCNIFFYKTGILTGAQALHDYATRLGFSKTTSIDLPYESSGFVPSPLWKRIYRFRKWFSGDTANLAIGQGELLVTPLQVARMMAFFANRGMLVSPYLVKAVDGQRIYASGKKNTKLSVKASTINYVRQGLRKVVSDSTGTANALSSLPLEAAGKTGTVEVPQGAPHGWFAGFFPFEKPKLVICVFLEHCGSGHAAVILAKETIEKISQEGLTQ